MSRPIDSSKDTLMAAATVSCVIVLIAVYVAASATAVDATGNAAFQRDTYAPDDIAAFHVTDEALGTLGTCTRTWNGLSAYVHHFTWWSIPDPVPDAQAHETSAGCGYDVESPGATPLTPPFEGVIDGARALVDDFDADRGLVSFVSDAATNTTATLVFSFERPDAYAAEDRRVRVTSTSDPVGLWLDIAEVASESDPTPDAVSGVFAGEVALSDTGASDPAGPTLAAGHGDVLTLEYFAPGGNVLLASDAAEVTSPYPTPTPIPSMGLWSLAGLAVALATATAWRLRRARPGEVSLPADRPVSGRPHAPGQDAPTSNREERP